MIHKFKYKGKPLYGCPECKQLHDTEDLAFKCEYTDKLRGYVDD